MSRVILFEVLRSTPKKLCQVTHPPLDLRVATRISDLARSTRDLLNLLGTIAEKAAGFKSLRDTWADTTTAHGRLMLTVLGGLAEFERELIRTRTGEGRERAKARGVILGRKPKLTSHQRREAIARREAWSSARFMLSGATDIRVTRRFDDAPITSGLHL
jgi:DNA invertase Pin-like site-specific DNA recombinase